MPIESWSADEVWEYLMSAPTPWGGSNRMLLELYKGSNQGECPIVIDTSTPSCGNSRFGCWTCTVVNEDKALHSLVANGGEWMKPLLHFRNMMFESTDPLKKSKYRNFKRRTGRVSYMNNNDLAENGKVQERKHVPGPYWMKVRQDWLKDLLTIEKKMRDDGRDITLIQRNELHAIRQQWLRDPNEPDWTDSLPKIFHQIYPDELVQWVNNDVGTFTQLDEDLLKTLSKNHGTAAELIMKLIETEVEVGALSNRRGIMNKIQTVLNQDWGELNTINERNLEQKKHDSWKEKLTELQEKYDKVNS
jgi:DNA sulfur modification protein DndC